MVIDSDQLRAERFNRDMAKREASNFYWGFISLSHHERMAIYALYNFARQVDDEADTVGVENLPARLAVHRARISAAVNRDYGDDPILRVLSEAIERYSIPEEELQMLIDGVEMDFSQARYQSFDDLQGLLQSGRLGCRPDVRAHLWLQRSDRAGACRRSRPRAPAYQHLARRSRRCRRYEPNLFAAGRPRALRYSGIGAFFAARSARAGTS